MAASVRAVVIEIHLFSSVATLRAEDGRSLVLTKHALGFNAVLLRKGVWLTCEVAWPEPYVLRVLPCDEPPQRDPVPPVAFPQLDGFA